MRVIIFTLSLQEQHTLFQHAINLAKDLQYEIIGIASLESSEEGKTFNGIPMLYLPNVNENMTDLLVLPYYNLEYESSKASILTTLGNIWHFPQNKIVSSGVLMKNFLSAKYSDSPNPEIQNTLKFWKDNDISVFNQYLAYSPDTFDEVFFDAKTNLPYILFETISGKKLKMYYPSDYNFNTVGDRSYVKNILKEQLPDSPHLYMTANHKVNEGDIIIDAGVCEGNFSLKYVDIAKKIYLFENDPKWINALSYTFKDIKNVEIIDKGVSNTTNDDFVKIDDAVKISAKERYFLKMDIEGYEIPALQGADALLKTNRVTSSICSYHKYHDDIRIKLILEKYGYKTSFSKGYMTFLYATDFWRIRDFRRAIVYGD